MQILFVDESGTPPPPEKTGDMSLFVLGGIVISENIWPHLAARLSALKGAANIIDEIKWRYFAPVHPGARANGLSHLDAAEKERLRESLYDIISTSGSVKLICVVVDITAAYQLGHIQHADDLYQHAYRQLTERFECLLRDQERMTLRRCLGIVVCDHRGPKDDQRLRELHFELLNQQSEPSYDHLIEGLFIAPSHFSVGIQLADMVAGAVFRAEKAKDPRFFNRIKGSFRTSSAGEIEDYGIVRFPSCIR